jgi:5-methylcytosine-specific restriction endonuclease McrA
MSTALRSLSNHDLLNNTKTVVANERGVTVVVLAHLNEVERRKLYLELGHSSMFAYCMGELKYSASAAKRRMSTARCIAQFPEALPVLSAGEINLSTVAQVSKIITPENSHALVERIRNKSQREVEAIVAEYDPLEALPKDRVRTVVVRVPVKATPVPAACNDETSQRVDRRMISAPVSSSVTESNTFIQDRNGPEPAISPRPATAIQLERRVVKQFCAREVVMNKIATVQALASHRLPMNAPFEEVIEFLADYFLQREDPKAKHERREARKPEARPVQMSESPSKTSSARAIPARVRDEVFVRDQGECCYVGPDGNRCGSTHVVQIDHVTPVARGGSASIDNLRLLCAHHNRLEAERLMGKPRMRQVRNGPELNLW